LLYDLFEIDMKEGWFNDNYWAICETPQEAKDITVLYGLTDYLPGYSIVGMKGWDDFILADWESQYHIIPVLPLDRKYLKPFHFPAQTFRLEKDERFTRKIKWYVQPTVFGGDPSSEGNILWLSLDEHAKAVKWWNKLYLDVVPKRP
jgi:hypothetical protein